MQRTVSRCFAALGLRQLRQIRRCVSADTLRTLVVSLVLSRLDYGNSVLVELPAYLVCRLQSVLKTSTRLILNVCAFNCDKYITLQCYIILGGTQQKVDLPYCYYRDPSVPQTIWSAVM